MDIRPVNQVSADLVDAVTRLMPQLTSYSSIPTIQELRAIIEAPETTLFVAYAPDQSGVIIGMLTLVVFRTPTGIHAWIEDVVVDLAWRGQGVGEALTRAGLDEAARRGVKAVDLTSRHSRQAANRLYQKMGFEQRETNVYQYRFK